MYVKPPCKKACCAFVARYATLPSKEHAWQLANVGLYGQYVNAKRIPDVSTGARIDAVRKFYLVLARTKLAEQPCW